MQPLIWESRPDGLRAPALVCAFTGWNDAGDAASAAVHFLGASLVASPPSIRAISAARASPARATAATRVRPARTVFATRR